MNGSYFIVRFGPCYVKKVFVFTTSYSRECLFDAENKILELRNTAQDLTEYFLIRAADSIEAGKTVETLKAAKNS